MNVLPYTLLLLTLMAILATARLHHAVDQAVLSTALTTASYEWRAVTNAEEYRLFNGWCANNLKPGPKKGTKQKKDQIQEKAPIPPTIVTEDEPVYPDSGADDFLLTERLNLAAVLNGHHQEAFSRLLAKLYPGLSTSQLVARIEDCLKEGQLAPETTEDLATLDFNEPALQKTWYQMLVGKPSAYLPLFTYVKWDPSGEADLELFRLPPSLLLALTGDEATTKAIIGYRTQLLNGYAANKKKTRIWEDRLGAFIEEKWPDAPWATHLSYKISTPDWDAVLTVSNEEGTPIHHQHETALRGGLSTRHLLREIR